MKKLLWIATTGRACKLQDMPRSDAAEPIQPLSEHTLTDVELELVAGGGSGGGTDPEGTVAKLGVSALTDWPPPPKAL
jgi:hypothetical protein